MEENARPVLDHSSLIHEYLKLCKLGFRVIHFQYNVLIKKLHWVTLQEACLHMDIMLFSNLKLCKFSELRTFFHLLFKFCCLGCCKYFCFSEFFIPRNLVIQILHWPAQQFYLTFYLCSLPQLLWRYI